MNESSESDTLTNHLFRSTIINRLFISDNPDISDTYQKK